MNPAAAATPFWPAEASAHAAQVDWLFAGFAGFIALLAVPVFVLLVVFAVRYRRGSPADRTHRPKPGPLEYAIEASWTVIPFALSLGFFVWAARLYVEARAAPAGALEVDVVAKQWMWKFQHQGGQREIDTLHVPAGTPVKLVMTSQDVIHSLYVPALRLKQDVLPGRYTTMWFEATEPGAYRLHCAEFCGTDHSVMGGRLVVQRPEEYARWLERSATDLTLAQAGEALFRRYGCSGCHGASATVKAPSLAGLFGSPVPLAGGGTAIADERYIRDSILLPHRDIAAGYPAIMPTFANLLGEEDLIALIAYIKSLGPAPEEDR